MHSSYSRSVVLFLFIMTLPLKGTYPNSFVDRQADSVSMQCEQMISVQSQPGVPVLIAPMRCDQHDSQSANVQFNVINTSEKPIAVFTISATQEFTDYKPSKGDKLSREHKYQEGKPLLPGWSDQGALGGGVLAKAGGMRVGPLTRFTLYVESVAFTDGSQWRNTQ